MNENQRNSIRGTINIPLRYAKAAIICASKNDARRSLNGVNLEIGVNEFRLISTDGARILIARVPNESETKNTPASFIIPRGDLKRAINELKSKKRKNRPIFVTVEYRENDGRFDIILNGSLFTQSIAGVFPDYRKCIPVTASGENAEYQGRFVGDFCRIARILNGGISEAQIFSNGNDAGLVHLGDNDCFGVVMPRVRRDKVNPPYSAWAKGPLSMTDAVTAGQ